MDRADVLVEKAEVCCKFVADKSVKEAASMRKIIMIERMRTDPFLRCAEKSFRIVRSCFMYPDDFILSHPTLFRYESAASEVVAKSHTQLLNHCYLQEFAPPFAKSEANSSGSDIRQMKLISV